MKQADRRRAWSHLRQLAEEHRVTMSPTVSRWLAEAHVERRVVYVPRAMRAPIDYLIALHELGHVCSPFARRLAHSTDADRIAGCEAGAWAWAVSHADPKLLALAGEPDWWAVGAALVGYLQEGGPVSLPA